MFERRLSNDKIKKKLCLEHNINILYVIEKNIKTDIDLYNRDNVVAINDITIEKIKDAR